MSLAMMTLPSLRRCGGLAALTVAVLLAVSGAVAAAEPGLVPVLRAMQRDLGALRVQLETIREAPHEPGAAPAASAAAIAYATDLADGAAQFRLRSLATMARTVARRLARLGAEASASAAGSDRLRVLRLQVHALVWAVEELRFAADRSDARAALDRLDGLLADLDHSAALLKGGLPGS